MRRRTQSRSAAFYLDKHTVSETLRNGQWAGHPSNARAQRTPFERTPVDRPVRFCTSLRARRANACYDRKPGRATSAATYRCPTEGVSNGNMLCRAGRPSQISFVDRGKRICRQYAVGSSRIRRASRNPSRVKAPNRWGLLNMHGNVWQWGPTGYGEGYYARRSRLRDPAPPGDRQRFACGAAAPGIRRRQVPRRLSPQGFPVLFRRLFRRR